MKAWRRSGGLGQAGPTQPVDSFNLTEGTGETTPGDWAWDPGNPDTFNTERRYNGGPWLPDVGGLAGTLRSHVFDDATHGGELVQRRIQAVIGGAGSAWTESNSVTVGV